MHEKLSCTITPWSMSLLNYEIYQRGWASRVADIELVLLITHLIWPPGSIPGVGRVRRNQTTKYARMFLSLFFQILIFLEKIFVFRSLRLSQMPTLSVRHDFLPFYPSELDKIWYAPYIHLCQCNCDTNFFQSLIDDVFITKLSLV